MNKEIIDRAKRFVENNNCWIDSDFTAEEKADEIAGLRNNDAFEWMADFAEECVKEERKRIADALESAYGGGMKNVIQADILNTVIALRRSAE